MSTNQISPYMASLKAEQSKTAHQNVSSIPVEDSVFKPQMQTKPSANDSFVTSKKGDDIKNAGIIAATIGALAATVAILSRGKVKANKTEKLVKSAQKIDKKPPEIPNNTEQKALQETKAQDEAKRAAQEAKKLEEAKEAEKRAQELKKAQEKAEADRLAKEAQEAQKAKEAQEAKILEEKKKAEKIAQEEALRAQEAEKIKQAQQAQKACAAEQLEFEKQIDFSEKFVKENMDEIDKVLLKDGKIEGPPIGGDDASRVFYSFDDIIKPYNGEQRMLYHGTTPEAKAKILKEGFNQRIAPKNGYLDAVGGTYFGFGDVSGYGDTVIKAKFNGKVANIDTELFNNLKGCVMNGRPVKELLKSKGFSREIAEDYWEDVMREYLKQKIVQRGYSAIEGTNYSSKAGCRYFAALDPKLIEIIE